MSGATTVHAELLARQLQVQVQVRASPKQINDASVTSDFR